ncbi:MAG: hypothetical protein R3B09_31790 [Nannocystaceae bacterium]
MIARERSRAWTATGVDGPLELAGRHLDEIESASAVTDVAVDENEHAPQARLFRYQI